MDVGNEEIRIVERDRVINGHSHGPDLRSKWTAICQKELGKDSSEENSDDETAAPERPGTPASSSKNCADKPRHSNGTMTRRNRTDHGTNYRGRGGVRRMDQQRAGKQRTRYDNATFLKISAKLFKSTHDPKSSGVFIASESFADMAETFVL